MPLTLLEYTRLIKSALQRDPAVRGAWVVAELIDVRRHPSGHCYMDLIEKDERGVTVARIKATIWRFNFIELERKFFTATGCRIDNGMKLMLRLEANMHELYSLSANIVDIDPNYTLGDFERLRREILDRLRKEGVLELNRQLRVPLTPQRIAVISAAGAAGYGDFVNQLASTPEGYVFYTLLFPAALQGADTSASVRSALERIEMAPDFWDCVVIIRGGGATSDLNGFDDYELARAVATFPIPVIVGIGHERDRTVLDEIACVRCKTPTAVAAWLVDALRYADRLASDLGEQMRNTVQQRIALQRERLGHAAALIPSMVRQRMLLETQRLDSLAGAVAAASSGKTDMAGRMLDLYADNIRRAAADAVARQTQRLQHIDSLVDVLSPQNTLRRGYSITRLDGKALRSAADAPAGATLETQLADGKIISRI